MASDGFMKTMYSCKSCETLKATVEQQKDNIQKIERRLRDLVKAYKLVVFERDNLLTSNQLNSSSRLNADGEKRLSLLESNVAELSIVCGNYEQQRIKDQATIDELQAKCEQLQSELEEANSHKDVVVEIKHVLSKQFRNKWTQTEVFEEDKQEKVTKEVEVGYTGYTQTSVATQTVLESSSDNCRSTTPKGKKSELAVVLPTQREIDETNIEESLYDVDLTTPQSDMVHSFDMEHQHVNRRLSGDLQYRCPSPPSVFSLFYRTELARQEAQTRDMKLHVRELECSLREIQHKYNVDVFKLKSEVKELDRQRRQLQSDCNFRPNLTYIRNVLLRFLETKDNYQRKFMINALLTALEVQINES